MESYSSSILSWKKSNAEKNVYLVQLEKKGNLKHWFCKHEGFTVPIFFHLDLNMLSQEIRVTYMKIGLLIVKMSIEK